MISSAATSRAASPTDHSTGPNSEAAGVCSDIYRGLPTVTRSVVFHIWWQADSDVLVQKQIRYIIYLVGGPATGAGPTVLVGGTTVATRQLGLRSLPSCQHLRRALEQAPQVEIIATTGQAPSPKLPQTRQRQRAPPRKRCRLGIQAQHSSSHRLCSSGIQPDHHPPPRRSEPNDTVPPHRLGAARTQPPSQSPRASHHTLTAHGPLPFSAATHSTAARPGRRAPAACRRHSTHACSGCVCSTSSAPRAHAVTASL